MPRRRGTPTREGNVLRSLRWELDLTDQKVAEAAGVTPEMVGRWERGKAPLSRDRLVEILGRLNVPLEALDEGLFFLELGHQPQDLSLPTAPAPEERTLIFRASAAAGQRIARSLRTHLLSESHRQQARQHRLWAEERWSRLAKLPPKRQERIIEGLLGDEKSWALAERICLASEAAAAHQASESLRLARLAVRVAEQSPGPELWRLRLRGWCEPFLANATRVGGELSVAEEVFARAEDLWMRGADGDPAGLLSGTRRLDLKASLLMFRGRFEEARHLLEQALASTGEDHARGRLLIMKANTRILAGDYEVSLTELRLAEPLVDEQRDRRLLLVQRFNRALVSCHLELYAEAEALLGMVEVLAADLGNELDQVRTVWLKGRTWAGLGRGAEALAALSRVRRYLLTEKIAYDFAVVSLEVAVLHLEQNRTRLVQEIAKEMLWIFQTQKVHQEALAALTLFCHAAEEEEVEAEWTRSLIKYLYRAQHNPHLRFEP